MLAAVAAGVAFAPGAALSGTVAPPSITLNVSGQQGDDGWYRSSVTVSWTVSDPTGISSSSGCEPQTLTSDTPGTALTCSASNRAKPPVSNSVTVTIKIDRVAPRVTDVSVTPGDGQNLLRWHSTSRSDTTRIIRTPRRGKGTAATFKSLRGGSFTDIGIENGREYVYSLYSRDLAGNHSKTVSVLALPKVLTLQKLPYVPRVSASPILRWKAAPGADYYHVQLFRGGKRIGAVWPSGPQVALPSAWSWGGHRYRLDRGTYRWYVWAGTGPRASAHYERLGTAAFAVR
jgi:hypothetical protein